MWIYCKTGCGRGLWDRSSVFVLQVIPPKPQHKRLSTLNLFFQTIKPFRLYSNIWTATLWLQMFGDPVQLGTSLIITSQLLRCHHPSHIPWLLNCRAHMTSPRSIIFLLKSPPSLNHFALPSQLKGKKKKLQTRQQNYPQWEKLSLRGE